MRTLILNYGLCLGLLLGPGPCMAAGGGSTPKPESTAELFARGVDAIELQRYAGALALFGRVVFETPDDADAWNYIGFSQRKLGRFDRAVDAYTRALTLDPEHRGALEYLGELYVETGQVDKARQQLRRLDEACGVAGCKERDDLAQAIRARQAVAQ